MRDPEIIKNIQKRFQTSMIGSLARIENYFGFMWGHDKEVPSAREDANRDVWEDLRTEILNHCNYQMRLALDELRDFMIKEDNIYHYKFIINKEQK